jgi:hypothetical protein
VPSKNWKPWWEKVGELDTAHEREEFMRGVGGKRPLGNAASAVLMGVIAGYIGGRVARPKDKK